MRSFYAKFSNGDTAFVNVDNDDTAYTHAVEVGGSVDSLRRILTNSPLAEMDNYEEQLRKVDLMDQNESIDPEISNWCESRKEAEEIFSRSHFLPGIKVNILRVKESATPLRNYHHS